MAATIHFLVWFEGAAHVPIDPTEEASELLLERRPDVLSEGALLEVAESTRFIRSA